MISMISDGTSFSNIGVSRRKVISLSRVTFASMVSSGHVEQDELSPPIFHVAIDCCMLLHDFLMSRVCGRLSQQ
jgi:hypothetical protein